MVNKQVSRVHVARLRRILGEAGVPLVGRSGGYLLDLAPERVDLHGFRGLLDEARLPHRSPGDRAALLREALGLWRGEPLAGLPGPWPARTRAAWHHEYVDATVAWAGAEILAGNPGATIGPPAALADQHRSPSRWSRR